MASIRYMIEDVDQAITCYTRHWGFTLEWNASPAFAQVRRGDLHLLLSGPQSSGARPLPDGQRPSPGGWNRLVIEVEHLPTVIETLNQAGVTFQGIYSIYSSKRWSTTGKTDWDVVGG